MKRSLEFGRGMKFLSAILSVALVMGVAGKETNAEGGIDDFVNRCYKVAFQREADEGGFKYWKGLLEGGKIDGSVTVKNFIFSDEYISQKTSDKQYVIDCYTMFMGREPDADGNKYWCDVLKSGSSRSDLFAGFANSEEFYNICSGYGITAGYYTEAYPVDQVNNVNLFVERLYKTCLGRLGDQGGQNYWSEGLLKGELTGVSCAANYILSNEYEAKALSNSDYIKNLYVAFMGREFDQGGLNYWLGEMQNGMSRKAVFAGFANSAEFQQICKDYGIVAGSYIVPEGEEKTEVTPTNEPTVEPTVTPTPTTAPSQNGTYRDTSVLNGDADHHTYVVNTSTGVFHLDTCSRAGKIKTENKAYTLVSEDEMIEAGWKPCGVCCK